MKFGVFLPNGSDGYLMTKAIKPYPPTWDLNKAATLEAEKQGLDFVLSMMKFRGFGGETGVWDACLESFSLMAALAAETERIGLVPTATILALHPAYVALTMATLDDISGGRAALNIVTGWNKPEYAQMGLWRGDAYYEQRYEYALEYVNILRALWKTGRVTHKSDYFNLEDCHCYPTPKHEIPIVSAGQSNAGRKFVATIGGHSFSMAPPDHLQTITTELKQAAQASGSAVGTYALFHLVTDETDEYAWQTARDIVANGDIDAIRTAIEAAKLDTVQDGTTEQLRKAAGSDDALLKGDIETSNMAFMSFPAIVGSYKTVARKIDALAANPNLDGILFSWPDWVQGIRNFGEKVIPLLDCRKDWDVETMGGLRGAGRQA